MDSAAFVTDCTATRVSCQFQNEPDDAAAPAELASGGLFELNGERAALKLRLDELLLRAMVGYGLDTDASSALVAVGDAPSRREEPSAELDRCSALLFTSSPLLSVASNAAVRAAIADGRRNTCTDPLEEPAQRNWDAGQKDSELIYTDWEPRRKLYRGSSAGIETTRMTVPVMEAVASREPSWFRHNCAIFD